MEKTTSKLESQERGHKGGWLTWAWHRIVWEQLVIRLFPSLDTFRFRARPFLHLQSDGKDLTEAYLYVTLVLSSRLAALSTFYVVFEIDSRLPGFAPRTFIPLIVSSKEMLP
jgi:hypothetical protein